MKSEIGIFDTAKNLSPSTRREWIEMTRLCDWCEYQMSPSTRREWIEMAKKSENVSKRSSPSTRREWIEMNLFPRICLFEEVSLHTEGVD